MIARRGRGHWCPRRRKRPPRGLEHDWPEMPPVVRRDLRQGVHIPSGEPFSLRLLEGAIVEATPGTPSGVALLGDRDPATWADTQAWWLSPPERVQP